MCDLTFVEWFPRSSVVGNTREGRSEGALGPQGWERLELEVKAEPQRAAADP